MYRMAVLGNGCARSGFPVGLRERFGGLIAQAEQHARSFVWLIILEQLKCGFQRVKPVIAFAVRPVMPVKKRREINQFGTPLDEVKIKHLLFRHGISESESPLPLQSGNFDEPQVLKQ
jgi:hypothetical protein